MHYIGIDLGGTSIKGAVVTEGGTILKEASCPTQRELGPEHVAREIAGLITALAEGYDSQAIGGVGVGCPGIVEDHSGIVRYSIGKILISGPPFRNTAVIPSVWPTTPTPPRWAR